MEITPAALGCIGASNLSTLLFALIRLAQQPLGDLVPDLPPRLFSEPAPLLRRRRSGSTARHRLARVSAG